VVKAITNIVLVWSKQRKEESKVSKTKLKVGRKGQTKVKHKPDTIVKHEVDPEVERKVVHIIGHQAEQRQEFIVEKKIPEWTKREEATVW